MTNPGSQRNPTIETLKDRIARDPFSRAFLQLAEEYRKEGQYGDAVEVCLQGLQRHPTYHTARISLGRTYMEAGDQENARRAFAEVLELQPENHLAAKLLAEIQKKGGDTMGAAATYRAILRYYPNDREVATLLEETLRQTSPAAAPAAKPVMPAAPASPAAAPAARPQAMAASRPAAWPQAPAASRPQAPVRAADPSPDFRAEDFGGSSLGLPPVDSTYPPADGIASSEGTQGDDALQTNTLAELYLRQGLIDRAVEVYRGMLRVDPLNHKAARRLGELAPDEATGAPETTASKVPVRPPDDSRRTSIARLERWLSTVRSASGGASPR